jgi:hypothetical protein
MDTAIAQKSGLTHRTILRDKRWYGVARAIGSGCGNLRVGGGTRSAWSRLRMTSTATVKIEARAKAIGYTINL